MVKKKNPAQRPNTTQRQRPRRTGDSGPLLPATVT